MFPLILLVFAFVLACLASSPGAALDAHRQRLLSAALAFFFLALILGDKIISSRIGS